MPQRRPRRLSAVAFVLLVPALVSCGFDYATERVNTIGAGVTNRDASVDVVSAMIVAERPGSGTFIASLSNNSDDEPATFTALGPGTGSLATAADFEPVTIPARGAVNLSKEGGPRISGDFTAGEFVSVVVSFDTGERVPMKVPVVTACGPYEGLDNAPAAEPPEDELEADLEAYACEPDVEGETGSE